MIKKFICKFKGHKWNFSYNHGIPLSSTESLEKLFVKFQTGEYYPVNRCSRCGIYNHKSDGLNPFASIGFSE
jgi:hypothetical protein